MFIILRYLQTVHDVCGMHVVVTVGMEFACGGNGRYWFYEDFYQWYKISVGGGGGGGGGGGLYY